MTRPHFSAGRCIQTGCPLNIYLLILILIPASYACYADQQVITDDGREVLLREDGTWVFRSSDRFANTEHGQRVRLKQDGSWQYVGNAPLVSAEHVRSTLLDVMLQNVVIERHEKKVQKNVRLTTQTVFYVNLGLSARATNNIRITGNDVSHIEVNDNNGKSYPVLSIHPAPVVLKTGSNTTMVIRADGSPLWLDDVKSMSVIFKPDIYGIQQPIALSRDVDDFEKKKVAGFE
jgi:hypothetical protein